MHSPFEVRTLNPVAGGVRDVIVPGGVWALEIQDGAPPGTRLGFDRGRDLTQTVPFDARGQRVPMDGVDRFWILWPSTLVDDEPLVLTLWTVPDRYGVRDGEVKREPALYLLHSADEAVTGSVILGPWMPLPDDQLEVGASTRMTRGARLVGYFGSVNSATFDVQLSARALGSAAFRQVKGWRGTGVPSTPTNVLSVGFDEPVPPGEFRIIVNGTAATVTCMAYLLLGP